MSGDEGVTSEVLAAPIGIGVLASTGLPWAWIAAGAAAIIVIGIVLVRVARRRTKSAQA